MKLTWAEIEQNAINFSKRWADASSEGAEKQGFLIDFFKVFGIEDCMVLGKFEYRLNKDSRRKGYVDYLWKSVIAIEMKSRGKSLDEALAQLKLDYMLNLPAEDIPPLWLVSDFQTMRVYSWQNGREALVKEFVTADLHRNVELFSEIAGYTAQRIRKEKENLNIKAAERMGKLHDALVGAGYEGSDLEVYLTRLLFCMFADDTGIFKWNSFYDYINESKPDGSDVFDRLSSLFELLNTPNEIREKRTNISQEMKDNFQYINGALFERTLRRIDFDKKVRQILLECIEFDWEGISPAIFGAMFQAVMDKEQRREFGAHYTSEENILKLINPLFMDELWAKFEKVKNKKKALQDFHDELATLKFLDPACGCGNFLIIAYRELRLLELEVIKVLFGGKDDYIQSRMLDRELLSKDMLKVTIEQFYGIEIEKFPCQVAQVGMWLTDHQMNLRVRYEFGEYHPRLPLKQTAIIIEGNALRMEWDDIVSKVELGYILGNPPFVGFKYASKSQKEDMQLVFGNHIKTALLDYVSAWYKKTAEYIQDTRIEAALVSTNSIVQGTQVGQLWGFLKAKYNININFAHRTFKWSNEAKGKAAVHCVIIGFSQINRLEKLLVDYEGVAGLGVAQIVDKISPYLVNADDIVVNSRRKPLCDIPEIIMGNQAMDGGNLIIEGKDYDNFIAKEPMSLKYIKRYMMGKEFINNIPRYCLWLKDCPPSELRKMPHVMERVEKVRKMRASSNDAGARRMADTPTLFREQRNPDKFVAIPIVSSENRKYKPMDYLDSDTIAGNKLFIIADATLYHFGILTSSIHMAWMRAICGRLEMRYTYSKDIVYNNFPWPTPTDKQTTEIETLAQSVLNARQNHPTSSLADLYDPLTMPPDLLKAHKALDAAVMKLYSFPKTHTEADVVAELMQLYQNLLR